MHTRVSHDIVKNIDKDQLIREFFVAHETLKDLVNMETALMQVCKRI